MPEAPGMRTTTALQLRDSAPAAPQAAPTLDGAAKPDAERPTSEQAPAPAPIAQATVPAKPRRADVRSPHARGDPLEGFNRKMFAVQDGLDRAIIRPAAIGYRHVVPKPVRGGLRHFLSNLSEPIVFLNYLLQLKPGKAAETLVRFTVNSTIGVGGLVDVAKLPSIGLPHRPNGFGNTLGFYGVKPGPYLFLPLVGPTDLRDFLGGQADSLTIPVLVASKPFNRAAYLIPTVVIGGLDQREQNDDDLRALYAGAVDPYASLRSVFLQDRLAEIDALHHSAGHESGALPIDESLEDPEHKTNSPDLQSKVSPPPGVDQPTATREAPKPESAPVPPELQDPLADPAAPPRP